VSAQLLKPALYTLPPNACTSPMLNGGRCRNCGYVFFPMQTYGCERCGATGDTLQAAALPAKGTLVASARVLHHVRKNRTPPYVVASVKLDDGPIVRTLLAEDTTAPLAAGAPMQGQLIPVDQSAADAPVLDLRFTLA